MGQGQLTRLENRIRSWESTIQEIEAIEDKPGLSESKQGKRREAEPKLNEALCDESRFWSLEQRRCGRKKGTNAQPSFIK